MNDVNALCNLLVSLKDTLEKLLEVENNKTKVLEKGNVSELDSLLNIEQAFLMECSSAEKQRVQICDKLQVKTVSELIEKTPDTSAKIKDIYTGMLDTIKAIKKTNSLNMKLLDTRLKIVKFMTSQLGISVDDTKYDKNAKTV
jgi:uncharacterized protein (UPF0216 family)